MPIHRLVLCMCSLAAVVLIVVAPAQTEQTQHFCGNNLDTTIGTIAIHIAAAPNQPVCQEDQSQLYGGQATNARINGLVFVQSGGHPCEYTMSFNVPLARLAFERAYLKAGPNGITHPVWSATAYDAAGRKLSTAGEDEIRSFVDVPARTFTLTGPSLSRVVVWSDDRAFDAFCNVVVDGLDPER